MAYETNRFEDENDDVCEIWLKGFSRILKKKRETPESFIVLLIHRKS